MIDDDVGEDEPGETARVIVLARLERHFGGLAHLREELAQDLAELFLRDLFFDVFVGAVEVRRIRAEAVRAEQCADQNHARLFELGIGLDLLGDFDAELSLEIDVDDDEIGARGADVFERGIAGLEVLDFEAEAAEMLAEKMAERARLIGDRGDAAAAQTSGRRRRFVFRDGNGMHAAERARLENHLVTAAGTGHANG